jgi:hypothetical protein
MSEEHFNEWLPDVWERLSKAKECILEAERLYADFSSGMEQAAANFEALSSALFGASSYALDAQAWADGVHNAAIGKDT